MSRREPSCRPYRRFVTAGAEPLEGRRLLSAGVGAGGPGQAFGRLPMSFEANQGQTDARVQFLARGDGYGLFVTPTEAVLSLQGASPLRMQLVGANPAPAAAGLDRLPGVSNYLIGNDPSRWHTNVPNFARVQEQGVYPGVDLTYYGSQRQLEYDFTVAPGADPGAIRLAFQGADSTKLDAQGNLVLHTTGGDVVEHAPVLYQESGGVRRPVAGRYVVGGGTVGFAVGPYDRSKPLVIDPTLSYSTYLGGSDRDTGGGVAVDAAGSAYVTGEATSADFPTAGNPYQPAVRGVPSDDAFVAKFSPDGSTLIYSTYLGGSGRDFGSRIAVDAAGDAYVGGETTSVDFPVKNAFQPRYGGNLQSSFVTKLDPSGSGLIYSSYYGGSRGYDQIAGLAVDPAGNAYIAGQVLSGDIPIKNAFQPTFGIKGEFGGFDAFVAKIAPSGSTLVYSTYLHGDGSGSDSASGIAADAAGNAYVIGTTSSRRFPTTPNAFQPFPLGFTDAFVTKFSPDGSALVYSTLLGGTGNNAGGGIAVDAAGSAYVTGGASGDFPTVNPIPSASPGFGRNTSGGNRQDAFVAKFEPDGSALVYSTLLGGTGFDAGLSIAVDPAGSAYVAGLTSSTDFPTVAPVQAAYGGGDSDVFLAKLSPAGSSLTYATYLGGSGTDYLGGGVAVDPAGNAYVVGTTQSPDFPTASPLQPGLRGAIDAFVAKISPVTAPARTTTTLTVSPSPAVAGQPVVLTAVVTGQTGRPTGTVTFRAGSALLGVVPLDPGGRATLTTTALAQGSNAVTAVYSGGGAFAGSSQAVALNVLPAAGPVVVGVQRFGVHFSPTTLVLTLSGPLDPASAQQVRNYRITGPRGRGAIAVASASYDPAVNAVTLHLRRRLDLHRRYLLSVIGTGTGGIKGASGLPLNSPGAGQPGNDTRLTVDATIFVATNPFSRGASAALKLAARARAALAPHAATHHRP